MAIRESIQAVDMKQLADLSGDAFEHIMQVFTEDVPKMMAEEFKGHGIEMDTFLQEIMQKTMSQLRVTTMSLMPTKMGQPTKFFWELAKHFVAASENVKREISGRFSSSGSSTYSVEEDIQRTRKYLENTLCGQYKTEVLLWRLMDEQRWEETLPIIKTLELERQNAELPLKTELINWKQQIAYNLGNEDLFYEAITSIFSIANDGEVGYQQRDMEVAVSTILSKHFMGFHMGFTVMGQMRVQKEGANFISAQATSFMEYFVGKIIEATFKDRSIKTGEDFRNFLKNKQEIIDRYKKFNPFVGSVVF